MVSPRPLRGAAHGGEHRVVPVRVSPRGVGISGTHVRRDPVLPQGFQASQAAAASDGHAVHCCGTAGIGQRSRLKRVPRSCARGGWREWGTLCLRF